MYKIIPFLMMLIFFACNPDEESSINSTDSLLVNSVLHSFEYNNDNLLTKYTYTTGASVQFFYNPDNTLSGFEFDASLGNDVYPTQEFEVTVSNNTEISGIYKLIDPDGIEATQHRQKHVYNIEVDLLKSRYVYDMDDNVLAYKLFKHDTNNNLIDYVIFENGQNHQLTNLKPTKWDDKKNESVFVTDWLFLNKIPFIHLPGYKISENNILAYESWSPTENWGETVMLPEYNDLGQLTRLYNTSIHTDEYGSVTDTIITELGSFEYELR